MVLPVFITVVGSKLYGTNTSASDTDFKGFGFAEVDQIIGLKKFEQQEYTNNVEDGPDKIEGVVYDIRRLMHLLDKGNPTVLEPCCAPEKFHVLNTSVGSMVRKFVQETFLTKHLFKPYSAYHRAQVRKLQSMERTGKRAEIVKEVGFDPKFASHAYRLARQCVEIMKFGTLNPTLEGETLQVCRDIRNAVFDKEQTLKILEDVDKEMYAAYSISTLPERPDFNKVNVWLYHTYAKYIAWSVSDTNDADVLDFDGALRDYTHCEILQKVTLKLTEEQNTEN